MDIFGISGIAALIIPLLIQQIKKLKIVGSKNAPLVALLLGIIFGIIAKVNGLTGEMTMIQAVIAGIGVGGASTGLYSLTHKTILRK